MPHDALFDIFLLIIKGVGNTKNSKLCPRWHHYLEYSSYVIEISKAYTNVTNNSKDFAMLVQVWVLVMRKKNWDIGVTANKVYALDVFVALIQVLGF